MKRAALGQAIAIHWERLSREFGDWGVTCEAFVDRVADIVAERIGEGDSEATLEAICLADLYLAQGCLAQNPRAIAAFIEEHGAALRRISQAVAPDFAVGEDVEAQILSTLFLPRHPGEPESARLSSYRGSGSLRSWLRIITRRLAIDYIRRHRPWEGDERLGRLATPTPQVDDELGELDAARRLAPLVIACLDALTDDERRLVAGYYRDGSILRELAEEIGVDTATVFRRLATARGKVLKQLRVRAARDLGLDDADLRGLIDRVAGHLNLDDLFVVVLFFTGLAGLAPALV